MDVLEKQKEKVKKLPSDFGREFFYGERPFDCLRTGGKVYWRKKERMIQMLKRLTVLFSALLFFICIPVAVFASGEGTIQIDLKGAGKPIQGAPIRVYFAGTPIEGGYRLTETFGGGMITQLDVFSPELADWLSERASGGWRGTTNRDGTVSFQGLNEGLYLVVQPKGKGGYQPFTPFLITIPWDGDQWIITATPKTEQEITVVPDTSDPGTVDKGLLGMAISGTGLVVLLLGKRKICT